MEKIYRFHNYGYIEVKAKSEEEARELIGGCVAMTSPDKVVFVCVTPTDVMDILNAGYDSLMYPAVK